MRSVRSWGVITSTAAPVLLIGGWTLAAALRPDHFDSIKATISALAATGAPSRWVMTAALVGVGVAHLGTALALVAGVSFLTLGIWPAISWHRHRPILPGDQAAGLQAEPVPVPFRPLAALGASAVLLSGVGWFFTELVRHGDRIGLSERVAAGSQALRPLAAVLLARASRSARPASR